MINVCRYKGKCGQATPDAMDSKLEVGGNLYPEKGGPRFQSGTDGKCKYCIDTLRAKLILVWAGRNLSWRGVQYPREVDIMGNYIVIGKLEERVANGPQAH